MAIDVEGLRVAFGKVAVLDGIDLQVAPGMIFALLGANGAGKTTTIRVLSTLLVADGGSARVCGWDVVKDAKQVRRVISLAGQHAAVDEVLTGRENLRMVANICHLANPAARADELLAAFDLKDASDRRVATYSGGMRRRLDLAMTLVAKPRRDLPG